MMPFRFHTFALALAALVAAGGITVPVRAQSLGEVAREEEARRKDIRQPAKVYTNKDLASVPPPSAVAEGAKPSTPSAAGPEKGTGGTQDADVKSAEGNDASKEKPAVKDQAYWSKRLKDLTTQLDRDRSFAEALQSRINALTTDFSARDDPAQRAVIGRDRQKALDELARLRKAVQTDQKTVADFQEEARRAAVPPGWLR